MKELSFPTSLAAQLHPAHLVDSLPYCDMIDPVFLSKAAELVEQEMKTFDPPDYLAGHFEPSLEVNSSRMEGSFRVTKSQYDLGEDFELGKAEGQISHLLTLKGHAERRLVNLGMYKDYATEGWQVHLEHLTAYKAKLEHDLKHLRDRVTSINEGRKAQQLRAKEKLDLLQAQWRDLGQKNLALKQELKAVRALVD